MNIVLMALDIGGASENGITIMNEAEQIIYKESYLFNSKLGKGQHRRNLSQHIRELCVLYKVQRIIVERVKLFRGNHISKLSNIESLSRLVAGITDATFDICPIYDVEVRTWKSQVLGNISKDKEYSINYVKLMYKLETSEHLADSICIAIYGIRNWSLMDEKKQNISKY